MNPDRWYDPGFGLQEWDAYMECPYCETETEHQFSKFMGATRATCPGCGSETEIQPDDWE